MSLRRAASLEVGQGVVSSYVHGAVIDGAGKMGVLVALESSGKTDELAAARPSVGDACRRDQSAGAGSGGLDPAIVTREKDVLADKFRQQGKPENVIEKIVESGLKTFYKEVCLLEQAFIHDEKGKSVAQAVKEAEGKIGAPVKVAGFVRYAARRGNREAGIRFRGRGRGRQRQEVTAAVTVFRRQRAGSRLRGDKEAISNG